MSIFNNKSKLPNDRAQAEPQNDEGSSIEEEEEEEENQEQEIECGKFGNFRSHRQAQDKTKSKRSNRPTLTCPTIKVANHGALIIVLHLGLIFSRCSGQAGESGDYVGSNQINSITSQQQHQQSSPVNYTALIKFESIRRADPSLELQEMNQYANTSSSTPKSDINRMDDNGDLDEQDDLNSQPIMMNEISPETPAPDEDQLPVVTGTPETRRSQANIYYPKQATYNSNNSSLGTTPSGNTMHHRYLDVDNVQLNVAESAKENHHASADCALILKRTYILRDSNSDEWGDKFVFNDQDPDDKQPEVHKSDLCIKHSDVDRAIEEAKHKMKFETPEDLDSFDVSERSISSVAELNLATGQLLAKKFDLSHDEILNALPMIDMSSSKFSCPRHVRPMMCMKTRYRTITAHCNNLKHPSWGATNTPYSRYLPPDYADGIDLPRAGRNGEPLPSARLISMIVHPDVDNPSNDHSAAFASWGQLLNHDVTRAALGNAPECCPAYLKGLCMPIPVPPNDDFYGRFNIKCLKFDRTPAAIRPKCLLGLRAQINTVTSPVDASIVYGSTRSQAQRLRKFQDGKMRVWNFFEKQNLKPLLPPKTEKPDEECLGRPKRLFCFEAGDVRVNEQTHLTVLHTIYVREHNRIAKHLAKLNLDWDDERIYQETRRIVYACEQHVVVNEFLPLLLGARFMKEYSISATHDGDHWHGYDPSVTVSTGTGFAAAAFRYGHSMVDSLIKRLSPQGHLIKAEKLRNLFKRPFLLYEPGAIDQLILGMVWTSAEQTDPFVSEELSGHLFQPPKAKFGHDLAAINIQRGRDQGIPGYNDWREWCGLSRAKSFTDLEPLLTNQTAYHYSRIYKHVDDIDLWSAGISERKLPGAAVGPTMACIIARQFMNTKRGDRFWYENPNQPSSFTKAQLKEIKKITLAKILCINSDHIKQIQPMVMRLPHPIYNAKVACDSLPSINLNLWDSNSMDNF